MHRRKAKKNKRKERKDERSADEEIENGEELRRWMSLIWR